MMTIYYWPHGTWCFEDDLEDYSHLSDDYGKMTLSEDSSYDEIDNAVNQKVNGWKL